MATGMVLGFSVGRKRAGGVVVGALDKSKIGRGDGVGALGELKNGYEDGVGVFAVSFWHKTKRGDAFLAPPLSDFRAVGGGHST